MNDALISIVLPVFNAGRLVGICISSILTQTYPAFELIIINDGSTDDSAGVIDGFAKQDQRIRVITTENNGVAHAFNLGISLAKRKYIVRMDADDEMFPERIALQKKYLDDHPAMGVVTSLIEHGGDRAKQEGYAVHVDWLNSLQTPEDIFLNRFVDSPVCNPSVMFRKELAEKHGGAKHGDFPEDYEMWLRWMENGIRFGKVNEVLLKWNDPETRATRNQSRYSPEAFNRTKTEFLARNLNAKLHNRKLFLCGAGRNTRKKSEGLEKNVNVDGFIDVDPSKIGKEFGGKPVISLDELSSRQEVFVLSYVGNRGAREEIRRILTGKGFVEGVDFLLAS